GLTSLGAKQRQAFGAAAVGALVRPHLAEVVRLTHPDMAVNDEDWLRAGPIIFVNARWLPPGRLIAECNSPCVALLGKEIAYAALSSDQLRKCFWDDWEGCLETWKSMLPHRDAEGRLIRYLWELVHLNGEQIAHDYARCEPDGYSHRDKSDGWPT